MDTNLRKYVSPILMIIHSRPIYMTNIMTYIFFFCIKILFHIQTISYLDDMDIFNLDYFCSSFFFLLFFVENGKWKKAVSYYWRKMAMAKCFEPRW